MERGKKVGSVGGEFVFALISFSENFFGTQKTVLMNDLRRARVDQRRRMHSWCQQTTWNEQTLRPQTRLSTRFQATRRDKSASNHCIVAGFAGSSERDERKKKNLGKKHTRVFFLFCVFFFMESWKQDRFCASLSFRLPLWGFRFSCFHCSTSFQ